MSSEDTSYLKNDEYDIVVVEPNENDTTIPITQNDTYRRITRTLTGKIPSSYKGTLMAKAHQMFVSSLSRICCNSIISEETEPNLSELIATATVSHDEHLRQNPK
jgi:hypothetical protein